MPCIFKWCCGGRKGYSYDASGGDFVANLTDLEGGDAGGDGGGGGGDD